MKHRAQRLSRSHYVTMSNVLHTKPNGKPLVASGSLLRAAFEMFDREPFSKISLHTPVYDDAIRDLCVKYDLTKPEVRYLIDVKPTEKELALAEDLRWALGILRSWPPRTLAECAEEQGLPMSYARRLFAAAKLLWNEPCNVPIDPKLRTKLPRNKDAELRRQFDALRRWEEGGINVAEAAEIAGRSRPWMYALIKQHSPLSLEARKVLRYEKRFEVFRKFYLEAKERGKIAPRLSAVCRRADVPFSVGKRFQARVEEESKCG